MDGFLDLAAGFAFNYSCEPCFGRDLELGAILIKPNDFKNFAAHSFRGFMRSPFADRSEREGDSHHSAFAESLYRKRMFPTEGLQPW